MDPSNVLMVQRKLVRSTSAVQQRTREAKCGPMRKYIEVEVSCTLRSGGKGVLVGRLDIFPRRVLVSETQPTEFWSHAFPGFPLCFEHFAHM